MIDNIWDTCMEEETKQPQVKGEDIATAFNMLEREPAGTIVKDGIRFNQN